jgi:hypothetical protein
MVEGAFPGGTTINIIEGAYTCYPNVGTVLTPEITPLTVYTVGPTMYMEATKTTGLVLGESFTVYVKFKDFTDLYGWQAGLQWDPSVLEATSVEDFYAGSLFDVLAPGVFTLNISGILNNTAGKLYPPHGQCLTNDYNVTGTSGTGYEIFKVEFMVKDVFEDGTTIEIMDGGYTCYPNVGKVLTPTTTPLTVYTLVGPPGPREYTVTLCVYAPGAVPETNCTSHIVTVYPPAMGRAIDLYTLSKDPFDGKGPNVECDAFAPQELVILCAKVTYNDDPVANKIVSFIVNASDGTGTLILFRTNMTNAEGIARVEFRIPSDAPFGQWLAYAMVDIAQKRVVDTMPFKVGWIIEILSITPQAASYKKGETAEFELEIQNIAKTLKNATVTVVIYDELAVPIAVITYTWTILPEETMLFSSELGIPMWAFVGIAYVYANAFTILPTPTNEGVPYCPEASSTFIIAKP